VQSVVADSKNRLWILDAGSVKFAPVVAGGAKLVAVDLATDKVVKSIVLKPTPVTAENLDVPLNLGWITKEKLCAGVDAAKAPAACK